MKVKRTRHNGKQGGYDRETKIGKDGRATKERHHTDYPNPKYHTNQHDHEINWSDGFPNPGPPINYPNGASEFKSYERNSFMSNIIKSNSLRENRFETISDFKWCIKRGGEVLFEYNNKIYGISPKLKRTSESYYQILISQLYIDNQDATEKWCDTTDEVLEYMIDGVRLRDVITEVEVLDRTI